jgi:hypothetical protein
MSPENNSDQSIATMLRDLDAVRKRLDQAVEWLRDGGTCVKTAAISQNTKHLCQQAANCEDSRHQRELLAQANECLCDLEKLLGLH